MTDAADRAARGAAWWLRWVAVTVLFVLAAVTALGAVTARFVHVDVLDTDHYVAAVAPLASDPAVQHTVTNAVTDALMNQFNVADLTQSGLSGIANAIPGLPSRLTSALAPVIVQQVRSYVHSATAGLIGSDQFATLWAQANRLGHSQVVAVLKGDDSGALAADADGSVRVQLAPVIDAVANHLSANGFTLADHLPRVDASFVVFQSDAVPKLQGAVRLLDRASGWLPWIAALLAAAAIAIAPRGGRRRAAVNTAIAVAAGMLLLVIAVAIGRDQYLNAIPATVLPRTAASDLFDALIAPLLTRAYVVGGIALAVAAVLIVLRWLLPRWFGPAPAAG